MDELELSRAFTPLKRPSQRERRMRVNSFAMPAGFFGAFEHVGEDPAERWGCVRKTETVEVEGEEPTTKEVWEGTFAVRELTSAESEDCAKDDDPETAQIKACLVRFGRMDVAGFEYEIDDILCILGHYGKQIFLVASNSMLVPPGAKSLMADAMATVASGKPEARAR